MTGDEAPVGSLWRRRPPGREVVRVERVWVYRIDAMRSLIRKCPPGVVLDPFMGSGSTLRAAKDEGRQAVGIEVDERYCEIAALRLGQGVLL